MHIESPVTKRSLVRMGFLVVLLAAFAAWFGKDGWVSYPQKNLRAANQNFPKPAAELPTPNSAVTEEAAAAIKAALAEGSQPVTLAELRAKWGEPAYLGPPAGAVESGSPVDRVAFFVGPYGWAEAALRGERVVQIQWSNGPKSPDEILVQKAIAGAIGLGALVALVFLVREMRLRFVLDDEGLALPGHGRIAFERMVALDDSDFAKKGILRLKYRDGDDEKTALLDEERIDRFGLCEKKSWPIPGAEAGSTEPESGEPAPGESPSDESSQ